MSPIWRIVQDLQKLLRMSNCQFLEVYFHLVFPCRDFNRYISALTSDPCLQWLPVLYERVDFCTQTKSIMQGSAPGKMAYVLQEESPPTSLDLPISLMRLECCVNMKHFLIKLGYFYLLPERVKNVENLLRIPIKISLWELINMYKSNKEFLKTWKCWKEIELLF